MFFEKKLTESYHKSKKTFEGFESDITHVSQDIRFLELLLKNYAPKSPFQALFAHECKMKVREVGNEKVQHEHHSYEVVAWEMNEKEKKSTYRIFYKKLEHSILPSMEGISAEESNDLSCSVPEEGKLLDHRPLVETPILTRIKIYPYLPTFLEKLAEELLKIKTKLDFSNFKRSTDEFERIMRYKKHQD